MQSTPSPRPPHALPFLRLNLPPWPTRLVCHHSLLASNSDKIQQCDSPGLQKEYDLQLIAPCRQQNQTCRGILSSDHHFRAHPSLQSCQRLRSLLLMVLPRVLTLRRSIGPAVSSMTCRQRIFSMTRTRIRLQSASPLALTMATVCPIPRSSRSCCQCELRQCYGVDSADKG